MRPLRWLVPGTRWFVTTRCLESRFFLKPSDALNQRIGFWLATALERFPGIRLHAIFVASNHLHAVLTDCDGSLSRFCGFMLGSVARDVNQLLDRLGPVFHRRFSAEPILDDEALVERIAYLVCNPVAARLTRTWRQWPGLMLWPAEASPTTRSFRRRDDAAYRAARRAHRPGPKLRRDDFIQRASLTLHNPTDRDGAPLSLHRIRAAIDDRETALTRSLRGQPILGRDGVTRRRPHDRPAHSARSPRPLCHASDVSVRKTFRLVWRALVTAYRQAAARFRAGDDGANFPAFTFPPWRPLVALAS